VPKVTKPPRSQGEQKAAARQKQPGSGNVSAAAERCSNPRSASATCNRTTTGHAAPGSGAAPSPDPRSNGAASAPTLDATKQLHEQRIAEQAEKLRKSLFPVLTAEALGYTEIFEPAAYQKFLERVVEDCGSPVDPIERMMIEQAALAHYRIATLHCRAAGTNEIDAAKVFSSAASRLLGEFRRLALALNTYRSKTPKTETDGELKVAKVG